MGWCKRAEDAKADKKDRERMIPAPSKNWVKKRDDDIGWHWSLRHVPRDRKKK